MQKLSYGDSNDTYSFKIVNELNRKKIIVLCTLFFAEEEECSFKYHMAVVSQQISIYLRWYR